MKNSLITVAAFLVLGVAENGIGVSYATGDELLVCGGNEVLAFEVDEESHWSPKQVWRWCATDRTDLPKSFKPLFNKIDECKPVDNGRGILVTSSSGGVAYVDRQKGSIRFYAQVSQAHSADLLPRNRIVVAASNSKTGKGDRLVVFDIERPNQELIDVRLPDGHGVVWDEQRQCLWALSKNDIRAYKLQDWNTDSPKLYVLITKDLPDAWGHDLFPVPQSQYLTITTNSNCWLFDRDAKAFLPHPKLANFSHVKSISQHPSRRQFAYVQANEKHWWSDRVNLTNPTGQIHIPGKRFYKARWNVRTQ